MLLFQRQQRLDMLFIVLGTVSEHSANGTRKKRRVEFSQKPFIFLSPIQHEHMSKLDETIREHCGSIAGWPEELQHFGLKGEAIIGVEDELKTYAPRIFRQSRVSHIVVLH